MLSPNFLKLPWRLGFLVGPSKKKMNSAVSLSLSLSLSFSLSLYTQIFIFYARSDVPQTWRIHPTFCLLQKHSSPKWVSFLCVFFSSYIERGKSILRCLFFANFLCRIIFKQIGRRMAMANTIPAIRMYPKKRDKIDKTSKRMKRSASKPAFATSALCTPYTIRWEIIPHAHIIGSYMLLIKHTRIHTLENVTPWPIRSMTHNKWGVSSIFKSRIYKRIRVRFWENRTSTYLLAILAVAEKKVREAQFCCDRSW